MIMEVRTERREVVTITLTVEEAKWLEGVMQNPLHESEFESEDPENRKNRQALFSALTNRLF